MKKDTLRAELWDNMHYLFRDINDRVVHVSLTYDFRLDPSILKQTLGVAFRDVPILHASFKPGFFHARWIVEPYRIEDVVAFKEIDPAELDCEQDNFLTTYIEPTGPLQMKVAVFYHGTRTTLCMVVNHMCMDAGSLKYFLPRFCDVYDCIASGKTGAMPSFRMGDRSYTAVYACLPSSARKVARRLFKNINQKDDSYFPFTPDSGDDRVQLIRRRFSPDMLAQVCSASKAAGVTVNDFLLTCYFQALYDIAQFPESKKTSISCAIDLRRHLEGAAKESVTNHTAWMQCSVPQKGCTMLETLSSVSRSVASFKSDPYMGLHGLPLVATIFNVFPRAIAEFLIFKVYSNPPCSMSNIGRLDSRALGLQGREPVDGFITGAIKYKPYTLLSVSTLGDNLTVAMCIRGNDRDHDNVERFFDAFMDCAATLVKEIQGVKG